MTGGRSFDKIGKELEALRIGKESIEFPSNRTKKARVPELLTRIFIKKLKEKQRY